MGSYISACNSTGKIVLPNGTVHTLDRSVTVAELMLEYQQTFIVEFRSNSTSKLLPLPADYKLDPNGVYLIIPMGRGRANGVLVEDARSIVLGNRLTKIPLFFGKCMQARYENGEEKARTMEVAKIQVEEFDEESELLCRQYSSKGWKPSLGTIQERNFEKKIRHWLFL